MPRGCVGARLETGAELIVDVSPMLGRDVGGIDVEAFDGVDRFEHALDLRPAADPQQAFRPGQHERHGRERRTGRDCAQYVNARFGRAVVAGAPADEREGRAGWERQDARAAVDDALGHMPAEADPAFDLPVEMQQLDMGERGHGTARFTVGAAMATREVAEASVRKTPKESRLQTLRRAQAVVRELEKSLLGPR